MANQGLIALKKNPSIKMDQAIFADDQKEYCQEDIRRALGVSGVKKGDTIFAHTNLKSFGRLNGRISREKFIQSFLNSMTDVIGQEGNLIIPTFSYSFCKKEIFDPNLTPSTVGILTEYFRKQKGVKRSIDPIFSVAALGPDQGYFLDVSTDCFGKNSIFEKLFLKNVKIVFFGETFDFTYLHFIEQNYGVPYRFNKSFAGSIKIGDALNVYDFNYYVKPLDKNVKYDLEGVAKFLEHKGVLKSAQLGYSKIRTVSAVDAFNEIQKGFKENVYFMLQERPVIDGNIPREVDREMYELTKTLFPICRSITGDGLRETLRILQNHIPLQMHEVSSGTKVFDWTIPKEWNIKDAYVMDERGRKVIDFKTNNLHILGYSTPVHKTVDLIELQEHLYSLPEQPEAIPYVTSYYQERWGFCIAHKERENLKEGRYTVFVDSELKNGSLTYGEFIIPGTSEMEVFLSTYICHPSMANNELSGPVVTTFLAKWIMSQPRKYTYRIIFIPETIGSLTYLSRNLDTMKKNVFAGFNISCVGDDRGYSYIPSRDGTTYADKVALNILSFKHPDFIKYSFLDRGSDERQYNAPGIDLPLCCILRSKYGEYPEYHTSLDNLDLVNSEGLKGAYDVFVECLRLIEKNAKYQTKVLGEPQLGKRGLYPTLSTKSSSEEVRNMLNFISYADGKNDLTDISNKIQVPAWELYSIAEQLLKADLIAKSDEVVGF